MPQTIVAGTAAKVRIGVAVGKVVPEQPLGQGIKVYAPGVADQVIASYPSKSSSSKTYDVELSSGRRSR